MARLSKQAEAEWQAAYRIADSPYTTEPCGCLVLVLVDMPDVIADSQAEIVREVVAGRQLKRCKRGELPPLRCEQHEHEEQVARAIP